MKIYLLIITTYTILIACSNDKPAQTTSVPQTSVHPEVLSTMETNQTGHKGITGYWKLKLEAYDNNENKILDEAERKKGIQNRYSFRFNADGGCQIRESFKGHYEVKTKGGNK